ncbi:MAG: type II toxin-antitoxin system VapC family toxin [Verrucomicrobiales bacterium]
MPCLPDTNVWIHVLRDRSPRLRDRFAAMQPADIVVCAVVKAELYHGAKNSSSRRVSPCSRCACSDGFNYPSPTSIPKPHSSSP